jgi:hypothetical protein
MGDGAGQSAKSTKWHLTQHGSLFADVRVDPSIFPDRTQPQFFTTLAGHNLHWQTQGAHIVYFPKVYGFRVYISRPVLQFKYTKLSVEEPTRDSWVINYIAVQGGGSPAGKVSHWKVGESDANWKAGGGGSMAVSSTAQSSLSSSSPSGKSSSQYIYIDVDTSNQHFTGTCDINSVGISCAESSAPAYITSMSTSHFPIDKGNMHWYLFLGFLRVMWRGRMCDGW